MHSSKIALFDKKVLGKSASAVKREVRDADREEIFVSRAQHGAAYDLFSLCSDLCAINHEYTAFVR